MFGRTVKPALRYAKATFPRILADVDDGHHRSSAGRH
jgi:hypothetical protein